MIESARGGANHNIPRKKYEIDVNAAPVTELQLKGKVIKLVKHQ